MPEANKQLNLLLIEDNPDDELLVVRALEKGGYEVKCLRVETAASMEAALKAENFDLVVTDYNLPGFSAPEALAVFNKMNIDIPFIVVSGQVSEETAVDVLLAGAKDFVSKNNLSRLIPAARREIADAQTRRERRAAEKNLKKNRVLLDEAQHIAHLGYWEWDIKKNELFWSGENFQIFGVDPGDFSANYQAFLKSVHPDDKKTVRAAISDALNNKKIYDIEHRIVLPGGREKFIHERGRIFYESGRPVRMIGTTQDITAAKQAIREIEQRSEIQSALNRLLNISTWHTALDKKLEAMFNAIIAVPCFALQSKGGVWLYSENPGSLKLALEKNLPDELKIICSKIELGRCLCGRAAETGQLVFADHIDRRHEISYSGLAPHGHYCVPIKVKHKVVGLMNFYVQAGHRYDKREAEFLRAASQIFANTIERARAEKALRVSEEKYRRLIESAGDGVAIIGLDGHITFMNRALRDLTGFNYDEMKNIHFTDLIHPDDRTLVKQRFSDRLKGKDVANNYEFRLITKPGGIKHMSYSGTLIEKRGIITGIQAIVRDITDSKKFQDKIRAAKTHYEQVIDTIQDAICVIDQRHRIASCNRAFAAKVGIPIKEIKGKTCSDVLPRYENDLFSRHCSLANNRLCGQGCNTEHVFQTGRAMSFIEENRDQRGRIRYHSFNLFPAKSGSGDIYQVVMTISDITERRITEEKVRRLSEFNQRILDSTPVSIITIDPQGVVTSTNDYSKEISKSESLLGKNLFETPFFQRNDLTEPYKKLLVTGDSVSREGCKTVDKQGRLLYLNILATPLRDGRGRIEGILSIALDNTETIRSHHKLERLNLELEKKMIERRKDEEEIRRLSEFNQRILDTSPVSIAVLDRQGMIIAANTLANDLMGENGKKVVGRKLVNTKEISNSPYLLGLYDSLISEGKPFYFENLAYVAEATGKKRFLNLIAVPLFDLNHKVEGAISMAIDNTEAVKAKEKLEYLNQHLETKVLQRTKELDDINKKLNEVLDLKSKFIADASHELRTPLTVIQGNLDLAIRQAELDQSESPELYQTIIDEVGRMGNILSDLTMLTNLDSHNEQFQHEKVNLGHLIKSVGMSLKVLADQKKIALIYNKGAKNVEIMGDEAKLEKLLINIVRNGIRYTEPGGRVKMWTSNGNGEAMVAVEDNGIGIPENDLPYIFERFYRVDKARSRAEGGSGLGLSIAKWIIDAHRGRIDVESAVGKGTKFMIRLPLDYRTQPLRETLFN